MQWFLLDTVPGESHSHVVSFCNPRIHMSYSHILSRTLQYCFHRCHNSQSNRIGLIYKRAMEGLLDRQEKVLDKDRVDGMS
jgi:hypothetical protein